MNHAELEAIKQRIEEMDKTKQMEVLQVLRAHSDVKLNENGSGIFVNLSFVPVHVLAELRDFIRKVNDQEILLKPAEQQKELYKSKYF